MLKRQGRPIHTKHVRGLRHERGIVGRAPVRRPRTTDSNQAFPRFPHLVEGLDIERPDQVWVADITSVRLKEDVVYLAVLMDVFTRVIRGWHLGTGLDQELTLAARRGGLEHSRPEIHHLDQGVQ